MATAAISSVGTATEEMAGVVTRDSLPDEAWGEPVCWLRWLPGQPVVADQRAGQA